MPADASSSQFVRRIGRALVAPFSAPPDIAGLLSRGKNNPAVAKEVLRAAMHGDRKRAIDRLKQLGLEDAAVGPTATAITDTDHCRYGLLHLSALIGEVEYVRFFVNTWEFDLHEEIDGSTPLMFAVKGRGSLAVAEFLCKKGASAVSCNSNGETPLQAAIETDNHEMLKLLLKYIDGASPSTTTPLAVAAKKGLVESVKYLLLKGEDPNVPDEDMKLPIEVAAQHGFNNCVEVLYDATADLAYTKVEDIFRQLISIEGSAGPVETQTEQKKEDVTYLQRQMKGAVGVIFAITDKLPTMLLGVCGLGFAYMSGENRASYMKKYWFQAFCGGCVISFCSSIVLHGYAAYY